MEVSRQRRDTRLSRVLELNMETFINDFGIKPVLLAAQAVNFFILLFLLKKFLYKPILTVLEERKARIQEGLRNAAEIERKLARIIDERDVKLKEATRESEMIIKKATVSAQALIEEAKVKANWDTEQMMVKAARSLEQEREKLRQEIKSEMAGIVTASLRVVVGEAISKTEQKKLIEKSLRGLT